MRWLLTVTISLCFAMCNDGFLEQCLTCSFKAFWVAWTEPLLFAAVLAGVEWPSAALEETENGTASAARPTFSVSSTKCLLSPV